MISDVTEECEAGSNVIRVAFLRRTLLSPRGNGWRLEKVGGRKVRWRTVAVAQIRDNHGNNNHGSGGGRT